MESMTGIEDFSLVLGLGHLIIEGVQVEQPGNADISHTCNKNKKVELE